MSAEVLNLKDKPQAGVYLIEASAGTGKTYSIAALYLHFILQGKKVSEILVVTFTEAATKELRERIRTRLTTAWRDNDETIKNILASYDTVKGKRYIENALSNFDQAAIYTIHGFCRRMLQKNSFESKCLFDAELLESDKEIAKEVVQDFVRLKKYIDRSVYDISVNKLLDLVKLYRGQRIVNEIDPQKYEEVLEQFLAKWEEERDNIIAYVEEYGELKHNKDCNLHALKEKLEVIKNEPNWLKDNLSWFKGLTQPSFCKCKLLKFQKQEFAVQEEFKALLPYLSGLAMKLEFLEYFAQNFANKKAALNVLTFDDLIHRVRDMVKLKDGLLKSRIQEEFSVALVDEFQDTDPAQYEIFSTVFGEERKRFSFYMIGDPKQSIYSFRGADIFAYLKARHGADKTYTLETNYRSEGELISAVNNFFLEKGANDAFAFAPTEKLEGIVFSGVKAAEEGKAKKKLVFAKNSSVLQKPFQLRWYTQPEESLSKSTFKKVPAIVANDIIKLLNCSAQNEVWFEKDGQREEILPLHIAILTNTHQQALDLKNELRKHGVPAVVKKSGNVFSSPEAKALLRFLEAVENPHEKSLKLLFISLFFSFTARQISELDNSVYFNFLKQFLEYKSRWSKRGFDYSFNHFLEEVKIPQIDQWSILERLMSGINGERSITNLFQLREILLEEEKRSGISLTKLRQFLGMNIQENDPNDEAYLQRLETDEKAVQILTIHKSKGLEFPIVFCPYIWDQTFAKNEKGDFAFHNERGESFISLDNESFDVEEFKKLHIKEIAGEHLRRLYVALTRAVNRCYLYSGSFKRNGKESNVLHYLADKKFTSGSFLSGEQIDGEVSTQLEYFQNVLTKNEHSQFSYTEQFEKVSKWVKRETLQDSLVPPSKFDLKIKHFVSGSYSFLARFKNKVEVVAAPVVVMDEDDNADDKKVEEVAAQGFFAFPKGSIAGVAIHEMFENIDFQNDTEWDEVIAEKLKKYQLHLDEEQGNKSVLNERVKDCREMIKKVLNTTLAGGFAFHEISLKQRADELKFFFPVKDISRVKLERLFRESYNDGMQKYFAADLAALSYKMDLGFLRGSIDFCFERDGKFYVVDWKSNHLGNCYENYHEMAMWEKVRGDFYFLQYHIYVLALHLFLERNMEGYSYQKHFGGVYYIFVRGVKPGTNFGVHQVQIPEKLVLGLKELFLEEGRR